MATPLANTVGILHTTLSCVGGESVVYVQGATTVSATALPGSSAIVAETLDGAIVSSKEQTFIFKTSDLGVTPQQGDTVTWGTRKFDVVQPDGERCYSYVDPYETMVRVFVQEGSA